MLLASEVRDLRTELAEIKSSVANTSPLRGGGGGNEASMKDWKRSFSKKTSLSLAFVSPWSNTWPEESNDAKTPWMIAVCLSEQDVVNAIVIESVEAAPSPSRSSRGACEAHGKAL